MKINTMRISDLLASIQDEMPGAKVTLILRSTTAEAVGDLVMSHRDHFGFVVKPQTGRISEEGK